MTIGRTLHTKAFLRDLHSVIQQSAPELLSQPVAEALAEAWDLCAQDGVDDYDPRLRNALSITAQVFDVDVGPLRAVSELPMSEAEALARVYSVGNVHSLASYLLEHTSLVFSNTNVESVYLGPVGEDSVLFARVWKKTLSLQFPSRYALEGIWVDFDYIRGPEMSEVTLGKQDLLGRGLEFFSDFARGSAERAWIAFPQYRLALGSRVLVSPWEPFANPVSKRGI